jgi:glycosyltransferase involved in cell wall biosynthesis
LECLSYIFSGVGKRKITSEDVANMKIMFFGTAYFPNEFGGGEVCMRILANELVRMGHNVAVVALDSEYSETFVDGVKVFRAPIANLYLTHRPNEKHGVFSKLIWHTIDVWNPVACRRVENIIKTFQPDIVHTQVLSGFSCAIWRFVKKLQIPVIHTLHDFYLICPKGTPYKNNRYCGNKCLICNLFSAPKRLMCRNVDHVIGVSHFVLRQHLKNGFFKEKYSSVIYNPNLPSSASMPDVLPFSSEIEAFHIGYISRLESRKGIEILMQACDSLELPFPMIKLYIAGEGAMEYELLLKAKAERSRIKTIFLGKVDPHRLYSQVHLVVVPSQLQETLGRIPMEAFSYGLPVVSTPFGGLPETTKGEAGVLAISGDAEALAASIREAVQRLIDNPERIRSAALAEARKYAPSIIAQQHLSLYESMLEASVLS